MVKRIALIVLALGVAWLYSYVLIAATGYVTAIPIETGWLALFPTRQSAVLTWMVLWHTLAIFVVSAPFGLLIYRAFGRRGIVVALLVTLALFSIQLPYLGELFRGQPVRFQIVAAFDLLKLIGILPCIVWIFSRLPSNQRSERP